MDVAVVVGSPGAVVYIDLVPMPASDGHHGYLVAVDAFSGMPFALPYRPKKPTSAQAFSLLEDTVLSLLPEVGTLIVDQDSALVSNEFHDLCARGGIALMPVFPGHQQANRAERLVQTIKGALRTTLDALPVTLWPQALRGVVRALAAMDNASKGAPPIQILTGVAPRAQCELDVVPEQVLSHLMSQRVSLWEVVVKNAAKASASQAAQYNKHRSTDVFAVGEVVRLRARRQEVEDGNFGLSPPYEPNPFIVAARVSKSSYLIRAWENGANVIKLVPAGDLVRAVIEDGDERAAVEAQPQTDALQQRTEFVVQKLHDRRNGPTGPRYLVEWGGYNKKADYTWEPRESLIQNAREVVERFDALQPAQ